VSRSKKRPRKNSGSGSQSETGSLSDTDEEDTSAVDGDQFVSDLTPKLVHLVIHHSELYSVHKCV